PWGASYVTLTPFSQVIGEQTSSWKLGATMFITFGVLALTLAAIGLYSVIAYNVAPRKSSACASRSAHNCATSFASWCAKGCEWAWSACCLGARWRSGRRVG
ncbi:MAG: hypothetical protein M3081_23015, partial [Gemmatimonadota bacterium]|nr:hypothetical protein [Gemmatimonadota bacterium]